MRRFAIHPTLPSLLLGVLLSGCGQSADKGEPSAAPTLDNPPVLELETRRFRPTIETDGWVPSDSGFYCRAPIGAVETSDALSALGYAGGFEAPQSAGGVTRFDRERVQPGLNLVTSGHAPSAWLMTSEGEVLQRWSYAYSKLPGANPNAPRDAAGCWRKTHLLPDGGLLAIYEGLGLVCLDRDSSLRWFLPRHTHHDLVVQTDGSILVLSAEPTRIPDLSAEVILEDHVLAVSAEGVPGESVSLLEALLRSPFERMVRGHAVSGGDVMHTNALSVLTEAQATAFETAEAGDLLVSMRELDLVAVIDPTTPAVRWAQKGPWRAQHDPSVLGTGRLLVFDNSGAAGFSRLLEFDANTESVTWSWQGEPPASFFSVLCGTVQRLSNGNTLVTETCHGRAFELDPHGQPVWAYENPEHTGADSEFVAALFEVERLDPLLNPTWLER